MQIRLVYFGFKADLKARKQCHLFTKYYLCKDCCERCSAVKPTTSAPHPMTYKNMAPNAPYVTTCIDLDLYVATCDRISPWSAIEGFQLETVTWDFMHVVYLGTARDHVPSVLKMLHHLGYHYTEGETDDHFLKCIYMEMKKDCKQKGRHVLNFSRLVDLSNKRCNKQTVVLVGQQEMFR